MKLRAFQLAVPLLSSALLAATGCGGDDGFSCGTAACGGDPVGTWTIQDVCFNADLEPPDECPDATISADFDLSGSITFADDETYTGSSQSTISLEFVIPGSCLPGLTSCDQLEDEDTTCTGTPDTECSCSSTSEESSDDSGTWTTNGNQINLDGDGDGDYCVDGNAMSIHSPSADGVEIEILFTR
jgi:hypothetical protein